MSRAGDDAAPVLAIVRAAGLKGFRSAERGSSAQPPSNDASDVLAIVRAAGLAGFKSREEMDIGAAVTPPRAPIDPREPPRPAAAPISVAAPLRMSRHEYAILHIAPGGEAALAALESRMGRPFAADGPHGPYYATTATTDGGSTRAFYVASYQRQALAPMVGTLGTSALQLRFERIPFGKFTRAGAGATGKHAAGLPPQLANDVPQALQRALR